MHRRRCTHRPPMRRQSSQPSLDGSTSATRSRCVQVSAIRAFYTARHHELHPTDVRGARAGSGSAKPQPVMPSWRASTAGRTTTPAQPRRDARSCRRAARPVPSTSAHRADTLPGSDAATVNDVMPPRTPEGAPPRHAGPAQRHDSGGSAQSSDTMPPPMSAGCRCVPETSSKSARHTMRMPRSAARWRGVPARRTGRWPCSRRLHRLAAASQAGAGGISCDGREHFEEAIAGGEAPCSRARTRPPRDRRTGPTARARARRCAATAARSVVMSTTCRKRTGAGTATTLILACPSATIERRWSEDEPDLVDDRRRGGPVVGTASRAEMRAANLRHRGVGVLVRTRAATSWCIVGPAGRTCGRATGISPLAACSSRARTGSTVLAASWPKRPASRPTLDVLGTGTYEDDDVRVVGRIFVATHDGPFTFVDGEVEQIELVPWNELRAWTSSTDAAPTRCRWCCPCCPTEDPREDSSWRRDSRARAASSAGTDTCQLVADRCRCRCPPRSRAASCRDGDSTTRSGAEEFAPHAPRTPRASLGSARRRCCRGRRRRGSQRRDAGRAGCPTSDRTCPGRAGSRRACRTRRRARRRRRGRLAARAGGDRTTHVTVQSRSACASSAKRACCSCHVSPRSPMQTSPACFICRCDHTHECWLGYTDTVTVSDSAIGLAARDADHLVDGNARLLHHADRLVAADDARAGVGRDALGAVEVVEVRVADDDPVALVDVVGGEPGAGRVGGPVDVRVEEDRQAGRAQPERRAAVPVECRRHGLPATEVRTPGCRTSRRAGR